MSRTSRIDYSIFASTGEKVLKDINNSLLEMVNSDENNGDTQREISLEIEIECIFNSINDFLDENNLDDVYPSIEEYNNVSQKLESLRNSYRMKHCELKSLLDDYDEKHGKTYANTLNEMKSYMKKINQLKRYIQHEASNRSKGEESVKMETTKFQYTEVQRILSDLREVFYSNLAELSDAELKRRKDNVQVNLKLVEKLSEKMEEIIKSNPSTADINMVELNNRYETIVTSKNAYIRKLTAECQSRELDKHDSFETSGLNIKLPKFKGYGSSMDIYTFQTTFEKLHLKSTPKNLLPDLLKNNFVDNPALTLIKNIDQIDEIWERLKSAYGDCKVLLDKRLSDVNKMEAIWKMKDPDKIADGLAKVVSCMRNLITLSKKHGIENQLYYGGALDKIYKLIGEGRMTRWLSTKYDASWEGEELWSNLIEFLEKDIKVNQQKSIIQGNEKRNQVAAKDSSKHYYSQDVPDSKVTKLCCSICGENDHVSTTGPGNTQLVQYFSCQRFVEMSPAERFIELRKRQLCYQCLFPGAKQYEHRHRDGRCQHDFVCRHEYHKNFKRKKHVLVCEEHRDLNENKELLEMYKQKFILKHNNLHDFSRNIQLSYHSSADTQSNGNVENDESAIYMLQSIEVNQKRYTLFYDSGCCDFVSRHKAVTNIGSLSRKEIDGPIKLGGVGGLSTESPYGIYTVNLPLAAGGFAMMTGVCLEQITSEFPQYPLERVAYDITSSYQKSGGDIRQLPKLPKTVGGNVDFMLGIKYLRYFPELVYQLPSGLTIYKSCFRNSDGSRGVIGGPHRVFTQIEKYHLSNQLNQSNFVSNQFKLFQLGYQINPDIGLLGVKDESPDDIFNESLEKERCGVHQQNDVMVSKQIKRFENAEIAGSEITYRCTKCRDCKTCKSNGDETLSIREEIEQEIINNSVHVDMIAGTTTARLPILHDPEIKLHPNRSKALKVFNQQMKKLGRNSKDKEDVVLSERKLQDSGHVEKVKNLPPDIQRNLTASKIQNFIPWRIVWKVSSLTTPCRMVFDASCPTDSGYSLNDLLAKGRNSMNKLVEIFIRWRLHEVAFHTDITKMYNSVKLDSIDWHYQRYLWKENLDESNPIEEKVIKTLIYGVKSSGNQAEVGLRKVAELSKAEFPEVYEMVMKDIYVDDCMSGEQTKQLAMKRADQLEVALHRGGFKLKGITMSGSDPPEVLSSDGKTINVAGLIWSSKEDEIWLDVKDVNFAKKCRGRKADVITEIPDVLTRRICTSKVAEIYDLTGLFTPIIASMKLDLHELVRRNLDWDDQIPDSLRPVWEDHFTMMKEIKSVKFKRAVVPSDAVDMKINTLNFGDSSKSMACITIYVRFKRKNGEFSSQLVFARSRIIPDDMSQPRAELYASLVNTHSGEVIKRAFQRYYTHCTNFTDSQIVLHWINNENRSLKQWVRNRVIEILRLTNKEDWKFVLSSNMIADLGTRKGVSLHDVGPNSTWINGFKWMKFDEKDFPAWSIEDIKLDAKQIQEANKECCFKFIESLNYFTRQLPGEVYERYEFSNYLVNPNKYRYKNVLNITAYVIKFVSMLKRKILLKRINVKEVNFHTSNKNIQNKTVNLSNDDYKAAQNYLFKKATGEIKQFMKSADYERFCIEKNGILIYSGRILPDSEITVAGRMTNAMKDLNIDTFCVPVIEKHSPLAYSIVNEVHWYNKTVMHCGIESIWRYVLKIAYIIEGRQIVKMIKRNCQRCRYLNKKTIDVMMGPVTSYNLAIAPCFYYTQVDLCGPFDSYSHHNKRAVVKIWLVVFCCATTSATAIKVMENYSTSAFIQSFVRFSCTYGYPKKLLSDEGSQLVKAFKTMELNYLDIKNKLQREVQVDYQICPVGGHNVNGKVERKIREIKASLDKTVSKFKLLIIQWETVVAEIANSINNRPLALGNITSDFECMDLLTPNRLLLGRNNDRSPAGKMVVTSDPSRIIKANQNVFDSWFEVWLLSHVPKLTKQPKWFKSDKDIKKGDIVLFLKNESKLLSSYQYGIVEYVYESRDYKIRKCEIKYRNHNEDTFRFTTRAVRELVVIHYANEIDLMEELSNMCSTS